MNFVVIDFETANASRSSACSLGLVEVEDGRIVQEHVWLIDPQQSFERINITIHGITPQMVAGKPTFAEVWEEVKPLLEGRMVAAHNAAFDLSVLRRCLEDSGLEYPRLQYCCSCALSKKLLKDLSSHRLNVVANHFGISLRHHDALEDARAAAEILLKLIEREQVSGLTALNDKLGCRIGSLEAGSHTSFSAAAPRGTRRKSAGGLSDRPKRTTAKS